LDEDLDEKFSISEPLIFLWITENYRNYRRLRYRVFFVWNSSSVQPAGNKNSTISDNMAHHKIAEKDSIVEILTKKITKPT
jgi:hypothetical protein